MADNDKLKEVLGRYGIGFEYGKSEGGKVEEPDYIGKIDADGMRDYLDFRDGILRGHNKAIYAKIIQAFVQNDRILIEQATGTGKSFLAMKLILDTILQEKDTKVLFVSPTNIIDDAFVANCAEYLGVDLKKDKRLVDERVNTCLYQGLGNVVENKYNIIILDEVHHIGAKEWGVSVQELLENNPNARVLGMSATMDRADGVDIAEILGKDVPVVNRLTLPMAIKWGILPTPTYILAKVKFEDDKLKLNKAEDDLLEKSRTANKEEKKQIKDLLDKIDEARRDIAKAKNIPQIFEKYLKDDERLKNGKFIVFCPAGKEDDSTVMETYIEDAKKWFGGITDKAPKIYSVHSKYGNKYNVSQIEEFENDKSDGIKLMFSVNMFNEGKHVDDIDGVIMLRPTGSSIIYHQQLGRALAAVNGKDGKQPVVFDFVANIDGIKNAKEMSEAVNAERINKNILSDDIENNGKKKDTSSVFELKTENIDILSKLYDEIDDVLNPDRFERFVKYYNMFVDKYGHGMVPKNCTVREVNGEIKIYLRETNEGKLLYNLGKQLRDVAGSIKGKGNGRVPLTQAQCDRLSDIYKFWDISDAEYNNKLFVGMSKVFVNKYGKLKITSVQKVLIKYKNGKLELYGYGDSFVTRKSDYWGKGSKLDAFDGSTKEMYEDLLKLDKNCLNKVKMDDNLLNKKFVELACGYCDMKGDLRIPKGYKAQILYTNGKVEDYNLGATKIGWVFKKNEKPDDFNILYDRDKEWASNANELLNRQFMQVLKMYYNADIDKVRPIKSDTKVLLVNDNDTTEVYNLGGGLSTRKGNILGKTKGIPMEKNLQDEIERMYPGWLEKRDKYTPLLPSKDEYEPDMSDRLGIKEIKITWTEKDMKEAPKIWGVKNTGQFNDSILQVIYYDVRKGHKQEDLKKLEEFKANNPEFDEKNYIFTETEEDQESEDEEGSAKTIVSEEIMVDESVDSIFADIESVQFVSDKWCEENIEVVESIQGYTLVEMKSNRRMNAQDDAWGSGRK